jgi:hypothetical protein
MSLKKGEWVIVIALLPSLCPMAKGKTCMLMFVLEILVQDRPRPFGSSLFFLFPKKPKKPKT